MPNPFADIGRSGVAAIGQDLLNKAVDVRKQETDMAQQNLGQAIDIQRFKTEQTMNQQEIEKGQFVLDAQEKEREFNNYKMPIEGLRHQFVNQGGMPTEAFDVLMEEAKDNGFIKAGKHGNYVTRQDGQFLKQQFGENLDFQEKLFQGTVQGLERRATELRAGIDNGELKGKDLEAANEELNNLMNTEKGPLAQAYNFLENKLPELREEKVANMAGTTMQPFAASPQVAAKLGIKPGETYYTFADEDTGQPMAGAAVMSAQEFEATEGGGEGITTEKAVGKITIYTQALAKLEQGEQISEAFAKMFKGDDAFSAILASSSGNKEDIDRAKAQINKAIDFYEPYAPEEFVYRNPEPEPEPAVPGVEYKLTSDIRTGTASAPVPPLGLPSGSEYIKTIGNAEYWTDPSNPGNAKKVTR